MQVIQQSIDEFGTWFDLPAFNASLPGVGSEIVVLFVTLALHTSAGYFRRFIKPFHKFLALPQCLCSRFLLFLSGATTAAVAALAAAAAATTTAIAAVAGATCQCCSAEIVVVVAIGRLSAGSRYCWSALQIRRRTVRATFGNAGAL